MPPHPFYWVAPSSNPDNITQVTSGRLDGIDGLTFAPDGRIVYGANHSGNWDLFVSDSDIANTAAHLR
jgi:hypothetical protein